jgi:hypothetical protein
VPVRDARWNRLLHSPQRSCSINFDLDSTAWLIAGLALSFVVARAVFGGVHQPGDAKGRFAIAGNLIYFSFVTLTTTGYGDIARLHPYARSLANVEAIIGQIYPATLLARLVTLELAGRSS